MAVVEVITTNWSVVAVVTEKETKSYAEDSKKWQNITTTIV